MHDLWGTEMELFLPQRTTKPIPQTPPPRSLAALECHPYGHSWQRISLSEKKRCTVCGITGYCPGCTPIPPQGAHLFFCTRHTPSSASSVRHEGGEGQP